MLEEAHGTPATNLNPQPSGIDREAKLEFRNAENIICTDAWLTSIETLDGISHEEKCPKPSPKHCGCPATFANYFWVYEHSSSRSTSASIWKRFMLVGLFLGGDCAAWNVFRAIGGNASEHSSG